jgi:hypothetical protein
VQATIPTTGGDVSLDLSIAFDEKGALVADGTCSLGGADVSVTGGIVFRKGEPWFDISAKCLTDRSKARILGPVTTEGTSLVSVSYTDAAGKRTKADVSANLQASEVTGHLVLHPQLDSHGNLSGTAEFVSGFENDPGLTGELTGRVRGTKMTFQVKCGKQRLTFSGKLDGDAFVGTLGVKALPEKGKLRACRVADPRQFL